MKSIHGLLLGATMTVALMACNNEGTTADNDSTADMDMSAGTTAQVEPGTYVDLNTGKEVYIIRGNMFHLVSQFRTPLSYRAIVN